MKNLPSGWTAAALGTLGKPGRPAIKAGPFGSALKKEFYKPAGYRVYGQEQVIADSFDVGDYFIDDEKFQQLRSCQVKPGDVLLSLVGTFGKASVVPPGASRGIINPRLIRLSLDGELVDPWFLKYYLASPSVQREFEGVAHGGTMGVLSAASVAPLTIPVPPVKEQRRIVAQLENLRAQSRRAKDALDAIPPLLKRFRQSVLAAAFRGDLTADWRAKNPDVEPASELLKRIRVERRRRWEEAELAKMRAKGKVPGDDRWKAKYEQPEPVDAERLPELPAGWCWAAWREIGKSQNGRPFPSADYQANGVRLLRPGNLDPAGSLGWTDENTKYLDEGHAAANRDLLVGGGELLMNLTAQSLKDQFLGRVCLSSAGERCLLNQRLARLTPIIVGPEFCLWLFKSPLIRSYIDGLNTGSLIQHMFTSQVEKFALPLPPLEEQAAIVDGIVTTMARIGRIGVTQRAATSGLEELDRATLAKAFRGELVPQDPNDDPASELLARVAAASGRRGAKSQGSKRQGSAEQRAAIPEET